MQCLQWFSFGIFLKFLISKSYQTTMQKYNDLITAMTHHENFSSPFRWKVIICNSVQRRVFLSSWIEQSPAFNEYYIFLYVYFNMNDGRWVYERLSPRFIGRRRKIILNILAYTSQLTFKYTYRQRNKLWRTEEKNTSPQNIVNSLRADRKLKWNDCFYTAPTLSFVSLFIVFRIRFSIHFYTTLHFLHSAAFVVRQHHRSSSNTHRHDDIFDYSAEWLHCTRCIWIIIGWRL